MIRIHGCGVRVIVRQPWLLVDPQAFVAAVTTLALDEIVARLIEQLQRSEAPRSLPEITLRLTIPLSALMGPNPNPDAASPVANANAFTVASRAGSSIARLPASLTLELAVHEAVSRAVHDALSAVGKLPELSMGPAAHAVRPLNAAAAIARTVGLAYRTGWLAMLLAHAGPTVTAEWTRILRDEGAAGELEIRVPPGDPTSDDVPADLAGFRAAAITDPISPGRAGVRDVVAGLPLVVAGGSVGVSSLARPGELGGSPSVSGDGSAGSGLAGPHALSGVGGDAGLDPGMASTTMDEAVTAAAAKSVAFEAHARHLAAAVALAERRGVSVYDSPVWQAVESRIAPPPPHAVAAVAAVHPLLARVRHEAVEVDVVSVLPFLLLSPLQRLGVLDAITAVLAGIGATDQLAVFAAGLARKVLPAPAHGWLQSKELTDTVAAFAATIEPPDGTAMERLADTVPRWWPVLRRILADDLTEDRSLEWPLLTAPSSSGLAIADSMGVFPIVVNGNEEDLAETWRTFGRPPMVAAPGTSLRDPGLPTTLDEAATQPLTALLAAGAQRPASGRPNLAEGLNGPLEVVAGVGLAAIAWQLWHTDERTHPVLALNRFCDLDGQVQFGLDHVTVRMPLGRRHADLRDSGLLETLHNVPWLDGRPLQFIGG